MALAALEPFNEHYPESDGKPMADNEPQLFLMFLLIAGFRHLFRERPDVHATGNLFWYPVEGNAKVVVAPDVMVIEGCTDVVMRSYRQWEHGGRPRLVIEILSESNGPLEMLDKVDFYDRYGVDELMIADPDTGEFRVWERHGERLTSVLVPNGWTSPFTGVRFEAAGDKLLATGPDGTVWQPVDAILARAEQDAARAEQESARADRLAAEVAALRARLGDAPA